MNPLPKGVWRYASLLLVLLVLAAVASYTTVSFLEFHPELQHAKGALSIVQLMLFSLIMGFLFLSGSLGLWGLRHVAELESRRRIGLLVDRMDYVADGVLVVDPSGCVVGSNPAARFMAGQGIEGPIQLEELFPHLSDGDRSLLADRLRPNEIEVSEREKGGVRALRFRSEPAQGVNLILISDVTEEKAKALKDRQATQFQMVGRLARGVAHDFNTILCAISGHTDLLRRQMPAGEAVGDSLQHIATESERGAMLARQLVDLSQVGSGGESAHRIDEHVEKAAEFLRVGLPTSWQIESATEGLFSQLPLSGRQVEQILLNLGLLVAGEQGLGTIYIQARPLASLDDENLRPGTAVELSVGAVKEGDARASTARGVPVREEGGVILSVLRTLVEDAGGRLDASRVDGRYPVYRVVLPCGPTWAGQELEQALPEELASYVARWAVLLACPHFDERQELERKLRAMNVTVEMANDQLCALATVEDARQHFAVMIFDRELLGEEAEVMLWAVLKLRPEAGLVVVTDADRRLPPPLRDEVVWVEETAGSDAVIQALIKARETATHRQAA